MTVHIVKLMIHRRRQENQLKSVTRKYPKDAKSVEK